MTTPASTAAPAVTGSRSKSNVPFFTYVREVASGLSIALQEAPFAVTSEAAGLMSEVPIVGMICRTYLNFEKLVETANSNKGDLIFLRGLCEVLIEGVLDKRSDRKGLSKGLGMLKKHVERAEEVAKRCNGSKVKQFISPRKNYNDISAIRADVLAICEANNSCLAYDTNEKLGILLNKHQDKEPAASGFSIKIFVIAALISAFFIAVLLAAVAFPAGFLEFAGFDTGNIVGSAGVGKQIDQTTKEILQVVSSKNDLAALEAALEEQRRVTDLASRVTISPGAPRIRDWYVNREKMVLKVCDRLGIGSSTNDSKEDPRMVGLAGPSGAGKSTVASLVIDREDVRASFHKGVLWLPVGQGGVNRLPELLSRLADMVYEIVMLKGCRPPRKAGIETDPEDGVAYIREVVNGSSGRFLVVADDVWEVEVLMELEKAGRWVLYTTRQESLLPEDPLRLDQLLPEEAEMVLRRAAELDDNARLPDAANELITRSEYAVLDLALVGRWSDVRGRRDGEAWQAALDRILETQNKGEGGQSLSWRAAVLRAGLEELACDNPKNKELYLSLAVIPKGLDFPSEAAAGLLYGGDFAAEDLKAARGVVATLERWSILTLGDGGSYRLHDEHADFIQGRISTYQDIWDRALSRWRTFIGSGWGLGAFSADCLVNIWDRLATTEAEDIIPRPYDAMLDAMDPSSADRLDILRKLAHFHWLREDWSGAYTNNFEVLAIEGSTIGIDHLDVATTLHNLGASAHKSKRPVEAEKFHRRALAIQEKHLGTDHLDVARSLFNLGMCTRDADRAAEAEEFYQRALAIRENQLGSNHAEVSSTLKCLGTNAQQAGRNKEAKDFYLRALAIDQTLGEYDDSTASTLHSLGVLAIEKGRTAEAERYFKGTLAIEKETLGADHLDMVPTLTCLAVGMNAEKRHEEAENTYRLVLLIQEMSLGVYHPDVADTLNSLGISVREAGRVREAEEYHSRALVILEKQLGADHLDLADTLQSLGISVREAGRAREAEEYHRRALAIREDKQGVHHLDVAFTLDLLGACLYEAGRTRAAEEYYRRALAIREDKLGVDHLDVAFTLHNLGVCSWKAGRTAKAEEFHQRELAIREEKLGVDHTDVADTLHWLGVNIGDAGRMKEAEKIFERALAIREAKRGFHHPEVAITRKALAELGSTTSKLVIKTVAALLAGIFTTVCFRRRKYVVSVWPFRSIEIDHLFRRSGDVCQNS